MDISFRTYAPLPALKGYIHKIWAVESSQPMPSDDMKLVVPNGRLLLIIPFHNGITGKMNDKFHLVKNNRLALVGMSDLPSIVDAEINGPTGTIGIEISAMGAYRFFHFKLKEIKNELYYLADILGNIVAGIEQRLAEMPCVDDKVGVLQQFLLSRFIQQGEDQLFDYCVHKIEGSQGSLRIKDLEKLTGYTSRWLNMKFEERLGISPKDISSIVRFQKYYQFLLSDPAAFFRNKNFFDDYHDGSHFIKEFKRFTGLPPVKLMQLQNEFGKTFYRD
jgi:hypothetical protein